MVTGAGFITRKVIKSVLQLAKVRMDKVTSKNDFTVCKLSLRFLRF